ncbi:hypothetical protein V5E97_35775 [Singulisphaera sp. Ch08]|uniref:ATP-binding protein n=1 Tax=Singulisphaera sp. Ch08 TaxID=3120278 RepID=A0AAU7CER1_9BACT
MFSTFRRTAGLRQVEIDPAILAKQTEQALSKFRGLRSELSSELDARFGEGSADSASFRQFQAEYQCCFPATNVDSADRIIEFLDRFTGLVCSPIAYLSHARILTLTGFAGVGKTHSSCDAAVERHSRGLRTVMLHGARFNGASEPWDQIRQLLGFDAALSRDSLLAALDAAGEASGKPLLLCIDGVNETKPRDFWRHHLLAMTAEIERFSWVKLCVTCRSTYEAQVLPDAMPGVRIVHGGFEGVEFDACWAFFEHYALEPPVVPILQPEFANPLFLQLVCKAMVAAGMKRLPIGWHGVSGALNALISQKNKAFADEFSSLPNYRYPERGLMAFVDELEKQRCSSLSLSAADAVIDSVMNQQHLRGILTEWLVREGLLIIDASLDAKDPGTEDLVRIAFERMGDCLLAAKYLEGYEGDTIRFAFAPVGGLSFVVESLPAVEAHAGLLEAFAVLIPERFGVELVNCCAAVDDILRRLLQITITTLPWRDPSRISDATRRIIEESLGLPGFSHTAFDAALSISALPSSADAFWLHDVLARPAMSTRDEFWCGYLHKRFDEKRGPVEKLIRTAFQVDPNRIPPEIAERWAMVLVWFCAAADRRVRDHATMALVTITEPVPVIWADLIRRLADVDDEYVVERGLAAAYGALLRSRNRSAEASVAEATYRLVFEDHSRFQNAAIRDYARSILELAELDQVLSSQIEKSSYMPPYQSEWPLIVPDEAAIAEYKDSHESLPGLYQSCLGDDFNRYTLLRLSEYEHAMDTASMGHWIFNEVLEMGYGGEKLANYDGYMIYRHGGGRGRPAWAERIGKKYQWIALSRLAVCLSDHVKPRRDRWDPKPLRMPLVYSSGRDIDPSLLVRGNPERRESAWWLPDGYSFSAMEQLSDAEWTGRHDDLPSSEAILSEKVDSGGSRWIILEACPKWRDKDANEDSRCYRLVWMNIQSYLVPARKAETCWKWLSAQNFMGRWMPDGRDYHDGFLGEYPWATPFNLYKESFETRFGEKRLPCKVVPTRNSLVVQGDSFQEGLTVSLPARPFFEDKNLEWDGKGGYRTQDGRLRFLDPCISEAGPTALLVDPDHLRDFLAAKKLVIIWTVLGEKLKVGENEAPRLVFNRVHMLDQSRLRSSEPVISDR